MTRRFLAPLLSLMFFASLSFAAKATYTKEERQKMADVHTKMAECLNSDKSMDECHKEMRESCKDMMGKECPMMGMGPMKGKMKGKGMGMMTPTEETKSEKKK